MGYFRKIDPGGWTAVQVSNFIEKLDRGSNLYQISDLLDQIDSMPVCKGIILHLIRENKALQKKRRLKICTRTGGMQDACRGNLQE